MNIRLTHILLGLACLLSGGAMAQAHEPAGIAGSVTVWRTPRGPAYPAWHPGMRPPFYGYRPYPGWHGEWIAGWGWGYPYPYPPPVMVGPPIVYVERPVEHAVPPSGYWYWCAEPQGWYPTLRECPAGWQPVLPRP